MITEIITTGTELLLGEIVNENAQWLASFMNEHGYTVAYLTTAGDNPKRLEETFKTALARADIVITSGGLGSTMGDITKKAGADALGIPFMLNADESIRLKSYYEQKKRKYLPSLERQAWFVKGAVLLKNEYGSASGSVTECNGKLLIHLPGPPFEMKMMAQNQMMPFLEEKFGNQGVIRSAELPVKGLSEAEIETRISHLLKAQNNPTIALLARPGYILVRVTGKGCSADDTYHLMEPVIKQIGELLPVSSYHIEKNAREDLVKEIQNNKLTISAAESCTGGLIGKLLTDLPGSSDYFKGSAVTYWNEAKENVLHVDPEVLEKYTAVSENVAKEMAEGARRLYKSDISVSTTGYAGPGSGERGEPAGLVYIGVSGPIGTVVYEEHFMGSRKGVRYAAAETAFYYAMKYIKKLVQEEREKDGNR